MLEESLCNSSGFRKEKNQKVKEIKKYLSQEKKIWQKTANEPKLLILGTSDSGKSTLMKQLKIIHGQNFTPEEMQFSKISIRAGVLNVCRVILKRIVEDGGTYDPEYSDLVEQIENDVRYFFDLAPLAAKIWNDSEMKKVFYSLPTESLPDSSDFFMDNLHRLVEKDYTPSNEDILQLRTVTQNIQENIFRIDNINFHFYDVSGLKYHRKYWMPYFDTATSILFVVAISCYDQKMVEDNETNRMADSIQLFSQILGNDLLRKLNLILFFNKRDKFEQKVKRVLIKDYFPDYEGKPYSVSQGYEFFDQKYRSLLEDKERPLTIHVTCATDTSTMGILIQSITQQIVVNMLVNASFA